MKQGTLCSISGTSPVEGVDGRNFFFFENEHRSVRNEQDGVPTLQVAIVSSTNLVGEPLRTRLRHGVPHRG